MPLSSPGRADTAWTPQALGLDPGLYADALRYLFDRPEPQGEEQAWYWNDDEPEFEATPLAWTRIQTLIFARAGTDLAAYSDEQLGMGLSYLADNNISNVPFAAIDPSVDLAEAMRMMEAMSLLWRDGFGPRLAALRQPIGASAGRLAFIGYMWFDVWPTFWHVRHLAPWRDALWQVLCDMLDVPCREVQVAALHGIGHHGRELQRQDRIDCTVEAFIGRVDAADQDLKRYAELARQGLVQ